VLELHQHRLPSVTTGASAGPSIVKDLGVSSVSVVCEATGVMGPSPS